MPIAPPPDAETDAATKPHDDPLAGVLTGIVGPSHVLVDPDLTAPFATDWTRRWTGRPRLAVRPGSAAEVAAVMAACAAAEAPVVPQGGNTGLVGGGVPRGGEVVISLRRLDHLEPVDLATSTVVVGAGVTLADAQRHARAAGLDVPIDFAARDGATLGGIVATNAGGERVLRYGTTRVNVAGLEAVLADGTVVRRMSGLPKDSAGFDLTALLVGSEGTLGIVTQVRLRLVPHLTERAVALLALDSSTATAIEVVAALRRQRDDLEAAELFHASGLALVCDIIGLPRPFPRDHATYLLVECAGEDDPADGLAAAIGAIAESVEIADAVIATDPPRRAALWRYREAHGEAISTAGIPLKLDVAVPVTQLAGFEQQLQGIVDDTAPGARLVVFGHLAEGNLHVNLLDPDDRADAVTEAVLGLVARLGGSIGAEHGVGQAKVRWLPLTRSGEELAAMNAVKRALDPKWMLNPGVVLPVPEPAPGD
jgi:FAD/FMN-containing dehydrogenase